MEDFETKFEMDDKKIEGIYSPCADCYIAEWIDMYGVMVWGCNMSYCIMDSDDIDA